MGLTSNCKDYIFRCICVATDLRFGNRDPWDAAIMPAWSLSESAVCPGDVWAEAVVGEPSTGEGGPLRSSPYTDRLQMPPGRRSPKSLLSRRELSPVGVGEGWFWVPSQQRRPVTPPQWHSQDTSPSTVDQTCCPPCYLPQLQSWQREQHWLAGRIILTYTPPPPHAGLPASAQTAVLLGPLAKLCLVQALYLFSFSMHTSGALYRYKIIKMTVPR